MPRASARSSSKPSGVGQDEVDIVRLADRSRDLVPGLGDDIRNTKPASSKSPTSCPRQSRSRRRRPPRTATPCHAFLGHAVRWLASSPYSALYHENRRIDDLASAIDDSASVSIHRPAPGAIEHWQTRLIEMLDPAFSKKPFLAKQARGPPPRPPRPRSPPEKGPVSAVNDY